MKESLEKRAERAARLICGAEHIIIGGGAGLSAAAGLEYSGERFTKNFGDFIKKYGVEDMYSATFYPFKTGREKWAYWARHIMLNRFAPCPDDLYKKLFALVQDRDYFVITTNVDGKFEEGGFEKSRIFAVQGDYGKIQCAKACHDKLYDDEELVRDMVAAQTDCKIPAGMVPKCPVCGGRMEVNVRKDINFVQDGDWYAASGRYEKFVKNAVKDKTVLIEPGVGYNTPAIIRFPFERLTYNFEGVSLIRINRDYPEPIEENAAKTVSFDEDMCKVTDLILKKCR